MAKYFSIGEMAKLHKISIQTLRYYDQLGLFRRCMSIRKVTTAITLSISFLSWILLSI